MPRLTGAAEIRVLLVLAREDARRRAADASAAGPEETKEILFPLSLPELCRRTGLSPQAVSRAVARLKKDHYVIRKKHHGAIPNHYRLLWAPPTPAGRKKRERRKTTT